MISYHVIEKEALQPDEVNPVAAVIRETHVLRFGLALVCVAICNITEAASFDIEVESLGQPEQDWLIVNDPNWLGYMDSKVYFLDTKSGQMLGMVSAGGWRAAVEFSPDQSEMYVPEIYFSRLGRGDRTDVVTVYAVSTLSPIDEIEIPPKRATGPGKRAFHGISDDGKLLYVLNMTPATSVSVVNLDNRTFVREIEIPGCALVYPSGNHTFLSVCGDGRFLHVNAEDDQQVELSKTGIAFDALGDPVTEKATRIGDTWLFVSFGGVLHEIVATDTNALVRRSWPLISDEDASQGWRVGGNHFVSAHLASKHYFVLMHKGGVDSHKDPGDEVWVYDIEKRERVARIELIEVASSIAVSQGAEPTLFTTTNGAKIGVYDVETGKHVKNVVGPPLGAGILQVFK